MGIDKNLIDNLIGNLGVEAGQVELSTDVIDVLLKKYIKKWQDNLTKYNHRASDNLFQSIGSNNGDYGFRVEQSNGVISIVLYLPNYYLWTDQGRLPTERDENGEVRKSLQGLTGWISRKGLIGASGLKFTYKRKLKSGEVKTYTKTLDKIKANKTLAFLIARKIHQKGFKGTNWFSSEFDNFESEIIVEMTKLTGQIVQVSIESFIPKK